MSSSSLGRSGSFKTIKISDSLSKDRWGINNEFCRNELEVIVSQFEGLN